jgi:signal peptidase I
MKKGAKVVSIGLIICITAIILFSFFYSKGNIERLPDIIRYQPLTILSNSMKPAFQAGDIVVINRDKKPLVNDVVTYKHPDGFLVTHRIIEKEDRNGEVYLKTKGDNNNIEDDLWISKDSIIGVVRFSIPKAGYAANFLSGPIGFFLFVVTPLLILAIHQIFKWLGLVGIENKHQNE